MIDTWNNFTTALDEPFTLGQAFSLFCGWQIGRAFLAYKEYRQYKKYYDEDFSMRQTEYYNKIKDVFND